MYPRVMIFMNQGQEDLHSGLPEEYNSTHGLKLILLKKYFVFFNYFVGLRQMFNSPNHELSVSHRYRFNDKFSLSQDLYYNPAKNDAGYYKQYYENGSLTDIIFSRCDLKTIENVISAKLSFNNKSGITFRARHYWSKVEVKELYDLNDDGTTLYNRF